MASDFFCPIALRWGSHEELYRPLPLTVLPFALKIFCKREISRGLRKNCYITILSLFGSETIFEVFQLWHHRVVKIGRQIIADIILLSPIF